MTGVDALALVVTRAITGGFDSGAAGVTVIAKA